ncbi:zinc-ribbon domain-containing protein [Candidatus Pelagibacter sp.]|nr:zinc-ribbon domain-containing protein [Candidatus Pelagibacter sp.]
MIITCPCEKKQFKIDNSLIPLEGRELQCGSCERVWFYKPETESNLPLTLNENASIDKAEPYIEKKGKNEEFSEKLNQKKTIKPIIKEIPKKKDKTVEKSENTGPKFFSYLMVFIISFVALVILLDTLKTPLINIFPGLELVLFNLFETLKDIKLFIIDLS